MKSVQNFSPFSLAHFVAHGLLLCVGLNPSIHQYPWFSLISVPQWPSDISGNDWCGPVNSSPAADRMSDEIFRANPVFWAEI